LKVYFRIVNSFSFFYKKPNLLNIRYILKNEYTISLVLIFWVTGKMGQTVNKLFISSEEVFAKFKKLFPKMKELERKLRFCERICPDPFFRKTSKIRLIFLKRV
jgi:hypothetical protein